MTVRINFLPRTYLPPKQLGVKEWIVAAAAAVGVVAATTFYMSAFAETSRLEAELEAQRQRHQQVKAELALAAGIRTREEAVVQAEKELRSLVGRPWSGVLLTLSDLTPANVTWNSLSADGHVIVLQATARGLVDVAQLLGGLVDQSQVEQVNLRYVNEQGVTVNLNVANPGTASATTAAGAAATAVQTPVPASVAFSALRKMDFELVITLAQSEGRTTPSGA